MPKFAIIFFMQDLLVNIEKHLRDYQDKGLKLFVSSSFQTQSVPLLHIISKIDNTIPIYFINTGFLFPETHIFKNELTNDFNLNVIEISSPISKHLQKNGNGSFLFCSDPDKCCYLNKTLPLDNVLKQYDVWINGIRKDQNSNRSKMKKEENAPYNTLRYHPMLDWTAKMIWDYIKINNLKKHPLENDGYISIGCKPCTDKYNGDINARYTRWSGMNKTECGLHTDLITK